MPPHRQLLRVFRSFATMLRQRAQFGIRVRARGYDTFARCRAGRSRRNGRFEMRRRRFMTIWSVPAVLLLTLPLSVTAQAQTEFTNGLLWRVEAANGARNHIFGTIHLTDPRVVKLPEPVLAAFQGARSLTIEMIMKPGTRREMTSIPKSSAPSRPTPAATRANAATAVPTSSAGTFWLQPRAPARASSSTG